MADLMDDYSTADVLARIPSGRRMTERERRRLMQQERAGMDLMAGDDRALENDVARRGAVADPIAEGGLGLMAEMTGLPSIGRGVGNIKRGWDEGSSLRAAGGVGEIALGVLPGASLLRATRPIVAAGMSDPVRGAMWGGGLTLPSALSDVSDARAATPDAEMRAKLAAMPPDQLKAFQKMIGATPDGRPGGETVMRAIAYEKQQEDAAKAAAASAAAMKGIEGDNAAKIEAARIKAQAEVEAAAKDKARDEGAKLPIRQLYPEASSMVPVLSAIIAGATGGKIRGAAVKKYNADLGDMLPRWKAAVDAKDPILAQSFEKSVNAMRAKGPGGLLPAAGAGTGEGALIGLLPEEIDVGRGVPNAAEKLISMDTLKRGVATGAMGGMASTFAGLGARAKGMKQEPVGDYSPETSALTGVNQAGVSQADAYGAYQAGLARNRGLMDDAQSGVAIQGIKNRGAVAAAEADAAMSERIAAEAQRRSGAPAPGLIDDAVAQKPQPDLMGNPVPAPAPSRPQPQPEPVQSQKSLPPPQKEPREWSRVWSEPARKSVEEFITSNPGVPLTALEAPKLLAMIEAKLPVGTVKPSVTTVRGYLKNLRGAVPDQPSLSGIKRQWQNDPAGLLFSGAGPAIAGGAGLTGLLGAWPNDRQ